ncbi:MAG: hypothetical protein ACO2ZT_05140 [Pontimonas sp.]
MGPQSFSSRSARAGAIAIWLLLAIAWGSASVSGLQSEDIPAALWSGGVTGLSWLLLWRPRIIVSELAVQLINPLKDYVISWPAITAIETTWSLGLHCSDREIRAWAVVAPGRHAGFWAGREQTTHLPPSSYRERTLRPADLIGTESGEIGAVVRRAWESARNAESSLDGLTERWSDRAIAVASLCALGIFAGIALATLPPS